MTTREALKDVTVLLQHYKAAPALLAAADQRLPPVFDTEEGRDSFFSQHISFPSAPYTQLLLRRRAEELLAQAETSADSAAAEVKEEEAARLLLQHQALTFQHLFLHQYTKRLAKGCLKKGDTQAVLSIRNVRIRNFVEYPNLLIRFRIRSGIYKDPSKQFIKKNVIFMFSVL